MGLALGWRCRATISTRSITCGSNSSSATRSWWKTNLIHELTLVKSPIELKYIREAARIAVISKTRFVASLQEGRSELEIAGEVYHALLTSDSGLAASPINLVSGERSCFSHGALTDRRLRRGDFDNVEDGATFKPYTLAIGRQFCLGEPTPRIIELYDLVRRASDACLAEIRAGVPAVIPHEGAKRVIADAGMKVSPPLCLPPALL